VTQNTLKLSITLIFILLTFVSVCQKETPKDAAQKDADSHQKADSYSKIYYERGNQFMNAGKYAEANLAYQKSLELEFSPRHLALYNLACSYARMNKLEEAKSTLESAIFRGYRAFDHLSVDPDLASVRSTKEWESFLARLKRISKNDRLSVEIQGSYSQWAPGSASATVSLCPSGKIVAHTPNIETCSSDAQIGTWVREKAGFIHVTYTRNCQSIGIGKDSGPAGSCGHNFESTRLNCSEMHESTEFIIGSRPANGPIEEWRNDSPDCFLLPMFCRQQGDYRSDLFNEDCKL